jgi:homogentisate 1,2-dioxygenase
MIQKHGEFEFQSGFGNQFDTEVEPGLLPVGQNSPQKVSKGLYAEQFSGTAFTMRRFENRRSWLYRKRPSVAQSTYTPRPDFNLHWQTLGAPSFEGAHDPNPMRWDPVEYPKGKKTFIESIYTYGSSGDPHSQTGCSVHTYAATASMEKEYFASADSEIVILPQEGDLVIHTELGRLFLTPGWIGVIPRGMKFRVLVPGGKSKGYLTENFGAAFRLPDLGPIGANSLALPRDFLTPVAFVESELESTACRVITKYQGHFYQTDLDHSPLDVMAWHGNNVPYQYDLFRFNTVASVSVDHPDPSIFTVLTSPSSDPGLANCDFVIFPPRWLVAENTFRPPYYHRNVMNEFMGLITGQYDAKPEGFNPGGASLHNAFTPHGPDAATFKRASAAELKPEYLGNTMAFMFECRTPFQVTSQAGTTPLRQKNYHRCWDGL